MDGKTTSLELSLFLISYIISNILKTSTTNPNTQILILFDTLDFSTKIDTIIKTNQTRREILKITVRDVKEILDILSMVYPNEKEGEIVARKVSQELKQLEPVLKYMEEKNLIQIRGVLGAAYKSLRLTAYGIDALQRIQKTEGKLELWDL